MNKAGKIDPGQDQGLKRGAEEPNAKVVAKLKMKKIPIL